MKIIRYFRSNINALFSFSHEVGPTMNLISGTHHSYEMRKYAFMKLQEYTIISLQTRKKYFVSNYITSKSNK